MKKEFFVEFNDIVCRKANESDNFEEIAGLIYDTDPYIYPYWFNHSKKEAVNFFKDKFTMPGFAYNINNIYIAVDKQTKKIVGLVVAYDKNTNLDFDYTPYLTLGESYKVTINDYVLECVKEAKEKDEMYFMNCAIDASSRSKSIGKKLLGSVVKYFNSIGYETLKSECLLHNLPIMNLCHALGFVEEELINGFNKYNDTIIEVVNVRKHSNEYVFDENIKVRGDKVNLENLCFRNAKKTDNLEKIASLLYYSDSDIYSYLFKNKKEAIKFLSEKILESGFIFSYENMYVAIDKKTGAIVGLIVSFDKNSNLNYDYTKIEGMGENAKIIVNEYFKKLIKDVYKSDEKCIITLTCDTKLRDNYTKLKLLNCYLKVMETMGYNKFSAKCLLRDLDTKNVYHKCDFVETKETKYFEDKNCKILDTVIFKRKEGKHQKEEFQKEQNFRGLIK